MKDHSGWYPFEGNGSVAQIEIASIGRKIGRIGYLTGRNRMREHLQPKEGEVEVRMKREELNASRGWPTRAIGFTQIHAMTAFGRVRGSANMRRSLQQVSWTTSTAK